jgi:hypothetical protein
MLSVTFFVIRINQLQILSPGGNMGQRSVLQLLIGEKSQNGLLISNNSTTTGAREKMRTF